MPSPVEFNVSLSPFPANWAGTPAEQAQATVDRLTVAPREPWSSFQNGGTLPASDVGPVLYNGNEWRVWDTGSGAYTYHKQNGAGLVDGTVPLSKLANFTNAGAVLISNGSKVPTELTPATNGQVLTLVGGVPTWVDTFVPASGGNVFEVTLQSGTQQAVNLTGAETTVAFHTARLDPTGAFISASNRWPVDAGTYWFFYAQIQLSEPGSAITNITASLHIRRDGVKTNGLSAYMEAASITANLNLAVSGVMLIAGGGNYVDVSMEITGTDAGTDGLEVDANATNTRFGGFRIL